MRARRDDGAVLVEYAFAFPVLLLVVVAALSFMWAAFIHVAAGQAAREGARYATVALPPTYRTHPDTEAIVARVRDRVPGLGLSAADVTVTYPGCPSPCVDVPGNAPVVVTVEKTLPGPLRPLARVFAGTDRVVASSEGEGRAE